MNKEDVIAMRKQGIGLNRQGMPWTDKELDSLLDMYNSGIGVTEIALTLQRTEPAIQQCLKKFHAFKDECRHRNTPGNNCRCFWCRQNKDCPHAPHNRQAKQETGTPASNSPA